MQTGVGVCLCAEGGEGVTRPRGDTTERTRTTNQPTNKQTHKQTNKQTSNSGPPKGKGNERMKRLEAEGALPCERTDKAGQVLGVQEGDFCHTSLCPDRLWYDRDARDTLSRAVPHASPRG